MKGAPPAATITLRQTLALLDGPFANVAAGVAEHRYALWLGSGISLGRVPGLRELVPRIIEFPRSRIDPAAPDCRFRIAMGMGLDQAYLSAAVCGSASVARRGGDCGCHGG